MKYGINQRCEKCLFTWDRCVWLGVCRGPTGRSFRVFTCSQSSSPFVFLQLCHPGHGPLTVHVFKLLHLFNTSVLVSMFLKYFKTSTHSIMESYGAIGGKCTFFLMSDITPIRVSTCCLDKPSRGTPSAKVSAPSAPGSQRCRIKRET